MSKIERLQASLMRPINPSLTVILGLYTMIWGIWIINPWWSVFSSAALYSAMASIAGEWFWGGVAILAGAVIAHGALKPSYRNLHLGAFVACLHWFAIGILYLMGDWMNTGGITALTFSFYSAIVWVNIKVNKDLYVNLRD